MRILDTLISVPPRENAGSRTTLAFGYQRNWALLKIMELHLKDDPYAVVFEFHDDLLFLDNETDPKRVDFFQVKTSTSNWTVARLTEIKKKGSKVPQLSILGKLFHHKVNFPSLSSRLNFVSNSYYDFTENKLQVCGSELKLVDQEKITSKIETELPSMGACSLNELFLHHSPLSADSHVSHIKGEILSFLDAVLGQNVEKNVDTWYLFFHSEIDRKGSYNPVDVKSVDDLFQYKCFKRSEVEEFLKDWKQSNTPIPKWEEILPQLLKSGWRSADLRGVSDAWTRFSIERRDSSNLRVLDLCDRINSVATAHPPKGDVISDDLNTIFSKMNFTASIDISLSYCKAAILWRICEIYSNFQEADS